MGMRDQRLGSGVAVVLFQQMSEVGAVGMVNIGFHMRDWWLPTKANFFGHLKKPQIIAALNEAGLSGAARDAEKMKKGDAAEHAEFHMKDNRWVPGWMCTPRPQAETETTEYRDNQADAA